jgi:hypothetical protein
MNAREAVSIAGYRVFALPEQVFELWACESIGSRGVAAVNICQFHDPGLRILLFADKRATAFEYRCGTHSILSRLGASFLNRQREYVQGKKQLGFGQ